MRGILIDWMVEVQESFELNHETLYLAVKLVDQYLAKHYVKKSELQLIGATAICVAAKFDVRTCFVSLTLRYKVYRNSYLGLKLHFTAMKCYIVCVCIRCLGIQAF